MFDVISNDDDLRHKYLACNAVLSITDYGDYKLADLVVPQAKVLYDAGKAAQGTYTELFEGVMDVLQVSHIKKNSKFSSDVFLGFIGFATHVERRCETSRCGFVSARRAHRSIRRDAHLDVLRLSIASLLRTRDDGRRLSRSNTRQRANDRQVRRSPANDDEFLPATSHDVASLEHRLRRRNREGE